MRKLLKRAGIALGVVIAVVALLGVAVYFVGSGNVNRSYAVETAALVLPADSSAMAHGEHLTHIYGCADCHGADLSGKVLVDAPPFRVTAPNLTAGRGGIGSRYAVEDLDRAVRHGIKPDGRSVLVMPSSAYHHMSDSEAATLIAYLQQVPPVDNELPPTEMRLPGRLMAAALIDPAAEVRLERAATTGPPPAPTAEYGAYLTSISCGHCHGEKLQGLERPPEPGSPPSPDLRAAAQWPLDQFKETLRTGIRPGGAELDTKFMPLSMTRAMTDIELEAVHTYLVSLQPANNTDP